MAAACAAIRGSRFRVSSRTHRSFRGRLFLARLPPSSANAEKSNRVLDIETHGKYEARPDRQPQATCIGLDGREDLGVCAHAVARQTYRDSNHSRSRACRRRRKAETLRTQRSAANIIVIADESAPQPIGLDRRARAQSARLTGRSDGVSSKVFTIHCAGWIQQVRGVCRPAHVQEFCDLPQSQSRLSPQTSGHPHLDRVSLTARTRLLRPHSCSEGNGRIV